MKNLSNDALKSDFSSLPDGFHQTPQTTSGDWRDAPKTQEGLLNDP